MAAADAPIPVRGDEGDDVGDRAREAVRDDVRRQLREPAQAALLPRGDHGGNGHLVGHGGPGGGEREPAARAFPATPHRPGRRRAAPVAPGAEEEGEPSLAKRADVLTQPGADNTTARYEQVEQHIASTLARNVVRMAYECAPKL